MAIAELIMPKMGESIMEATILKWHKKVGDHVKLDETVLDIATDKVDSEIPSPFEGIITEISYPVNSVVAVGSVIAKIETAKNVLSNSAPAPAPVHTQPAPVVTPPIVEQHIPTPTPIVEAASVIPSSFEEDIPFQPYSGAPKTGNNRFFSPLVLNIANSEGISLSELERIPGTGADGRVSKKDVIQYVADKRAGKVPAFVSGQSAPQVVYVQQPPVHEYAQPLVVIPTPVQQVILQKAADAPVYIAPQPIVEQPLIYPTTVAEPAAPVYESVVAPVANAAETFIPQPIVESAPVSQPIAESYTHPIVEPVIAAQPSATTFEQPIVAPALSQPIVEAHNPVIVPAIAAQPSATTFVQPIIAPAASQPITDTYSHPIVEPVIAAQPSVAPIHTPVINPSSSYEQNFVPQPIVEPISVPKTEVASSFSSVIAPHPIVESIATPVHEPVTVVTPRIAVVAPVIEPIASVVPTPIVEPAPTPIVEKVVEPIVAKSEVSSSLSPVYMVPPTAPTVPLVTLAEGDSGKYTTPNAVHPTGNVEIIEMDRMRRLISKHMVDSKQTSAHVTSFTEADVTNMVLWRDRVKQDFERREGTKLTFTPMFIDCIVKVLKRYPLLNASVDGDRIIIKKDLNIGMATALPTGNLIVPVIKGADQLNIVGLSAAVNKLATDARNNQLKPEDVTGGTFTFTNVGTFGTLMGTPIINQPQVAILAVGVIKKRPVVIESLHNDTIGIRHMMYLSLSYDHRIIDGSVGSKFLTDVAKEFEDWDLNRTWYHYL